MLNHDQLLSLLKQCVRDAGSQKTFAIQHGISQQYLTDVLKKRRMPGAKILQVLGYESVIVYKKIYQTNRDKQDPVT